MQLGPCTASWGDEISGESRSTADEFKLLAGIDSGSEG